jgi:hypothetical protein
VKQDFYLGMPYVGAALMAFFVFASVFVVALFHALRTSTGALDPLQRLPLDEPGERR